MRVNCLILLVITDYKINELKPCVIKLNVFTKEIALVLLVSGENIDCFDYL